MSTSKIYSLLLLSSTSLLFSCSINLKPYLNPKTNPSVYKWSFRSPNGDSLIGRKKVTFIEIPIQSKVGYYVNEIKDTGRLFAGIQDDYFLSSVIIFEKDSFLLAPIEFKSQLEHITLERFIYKIPYKVNLSDTFLIRLRGNEYTKLYGFTKTSVTINKKKFKNCLLIKCPVIVRDKLSQAEVILHKKYGVLSWKRASGRIDVITF